MAVIEPPSITDAPPAPQRSVKATFSGRVDAFVTWLVVAVAQFGALALNVYNNAMEAFSYSTAAGASASAAAASAEIAADSAAAAAVTTGATLWVSGQTVAQDAAKISPLNRKTYRRKTASGSGTTDPSLDSANYVLLSVDNSSAFVLVEVLISTPVAVVNMLTSFSDLYDSYRLEFDGVTLDTPHPQPVKIRLAQAGVADATSSYVKFALGPGSSRRALTDVDPFFYLNFSGDIASITGSVEFINMRDAGAATKLRALFAEFIGYGATVSPSATPGVQSALEGVVFNKPGQVSGVQIYPNSGNYTAGKVRLIGYRNS